MDNEIYLDGNATTAVLPAALRAALLAMEECYGNPSSTHATGLKAKAVLDAARARACRLLGVGPGRLMFNSGATEGIQTAVLSALCAVRARRLAGELAGTLLVYGATEHKAVPESLAHWNALLGLDLELVALPVGTDGRHDLAALRRLAPAAAFVCTMAANNETGVISDLTGIAAALEGSPALWMVDCVQALGKLPLDLAATRIDYAPFSGHKLYAPKGIGMLYVRAGAPFTPLMKGGGQETGWRSGTENMAGIAALGAVLAALEDGTLFASHAEQCMFRERLAAALRQALPGIVFNAPFDDALPTTLNFSVPGVSGKELLDLFDAAAVRVSAGSACSAAKAQPSYVLAAMGLPEWRSSNAVRLSFGPLMDDATVADACARIARCGGALRLAGMLGEPATTRPDGLLQLSDGGRHTWLVLDAASGTCAVIDPQPALAERIDALLRTHGFRVAARLSTRNGAGWPASGDSIELGRQSLRRVMIGAGTPCYLLGPAGERPRHAFIGDAAPSGLAGHVPPEALLCPAAEALSTLCAHPAPAGDIDLDAAGLAALLRQRPDAVLVDVREPHEHAVAVPFLGVPAASVPLSRLAGELPRWMAQAGQVPLVFYCRSGNRSARAAGCLRSLGYPQAYHVHGGVALA
ncbi:aminotransferase class V-fold PLP-dependent enzyme [Pseudoduganella umbonata]|uniref:cysteine desulfurase n=1 Tax=Pseudoduganella umbonata TaxID=864828 RepID=A0A4P8HUC9_9BURK|nr:aminotransferase class V-fold PLP-dependent enzyme [Pseudoduganella umbonata]MBB3225300.1 cysteine sulfinate desulfinase/cysteine desulfurase-like protein/rhodanese-related sulfurtransferase [Pseudoduganella umbonata]QCP12896.1 aminotransferase class V-fold PLP-dependent enzyme [Pseudoduganella umbonata]